MTTTMETELRSLPLEVRAVTDGEKRKLVGTTAPFNKWSEDLGGFRERIAPGAFARAISEGQDVVCVFNHDASVLLGRTSSGTLTLKEGRSGLEFEAELPDTQAARDLMTLVERRDVAHCSFKFRTVKDQWEFASKPGKLDERTLLDVDLFDIGPVVNAAYPDTKVAARSLDQARAAAEPKRDFSRELELAEAGLDLSPPPCR